MAFDEHGLPLAHEVFEGNAADTTTLVTLLDRLEVQDAGLKPVVILDAGFASQIEPDTAPAARLFLSD